MKVCIFLFIFIFIICIIDIYGETRNTATLTLSCIMPEIIGVNIDAKSPIAEKTHEDIYYVASDHKDSEGKSSNQEYSNEYSNIEIIIVETVKDDEPTILKTVVAK